MLDTLAKIYSLQADALVVKYTGSRAIRDRARQADLVCADEEDEEITVSSDDELAAAFQNTHASCATCLKIVVTKVDPPAVVPTPAVVPPMTTMFNLPPTTINLPPGICRSIL
jgi:hypothetical protein